MEYLKPEYFQKIAIFGAGGLGKTTLAVEVLHRKATLEDLFLRLTGRELDE